MHMRPCAGLKSTNDNLVFFFDVDKQIKFDVDKQIKERLPVIRKALFCSGCYYSSVIHRP